MAKRHVSEGATEVQQTLDFGNYPLHLTTLLGEGRRNSEVPVSISFPQCFPGLQMLFSLFFWPNLTPKLGSSQLLAGPVSQLYWLQLKHRCGTGAPALGVGKKPATFQGFWGVPTHWQPPKIPFRASRNPYLLLFPWDSPRNGEVTAGRADAATAIL